MIAFRKTLLAAALCLAAPLAAQEHPAAIHVHDAYALVSPGGATGAVFFMIHNHTAADVVLTGASAPVAQKVELHTHKDLGDGVMQMVPIEGGIPLPAGAMHELARGGDHVMLMGLTQALKAGDHFDLTLTFDGAAPVTLDVAVEGSPQGGMGGMGGAGGMGHQHGMSGAAPSN